MFGADTDDLLLLLKQNLRIPNGVTDIQNVSLRKMHSSLLMSSSSLSPNLPAFSHILDDNFANILGRCVPAFQLPFCPPIYNNLTSYPNIFMHKNAKEVNEDVIVFRWVNKTATYIHFSPVALMWLILLSMRMFNCTYTTIAKSLNLEVIFHQ